MNDIVPIDPVSTAIKEATQAAKEFLGELISPALKEGGGVLQDTIKYWRFQNQVNLVLKAKKFLQEKGINPRQVLPKTLLPIIEGGSLEENEEMRDKWSAMLAHAADPTSDVIVRPSYPEILKQLSPLEAKILDNFYESIKEKSIEERGKVGIDGAKVQKVFKISKDEYDVLIGNLLRLGLIRMPSSEGGVSIGSAPIALHTYDFTYLTPLGIDFIRACKY